MQTTRTKATWAGLAVVGGTVTGYAYWKNKYGPKKKKKLAPMDTNTVNPAAVAK